LPSLVLLEWTNCISNISRWFCWNKNIHLWFITEIFFISDTTYQPLYFTQFRLHISIYHTLHSVFHPLQITHSISLTTHQSLYITHCISFKCISLTVYNSLQITCRTSLTTHKISVNHSLCISLTVYHSLSLIYHLLKITYCILLTTDHCISLTMYITHYRSLTVYHSL
jgi:hypothetical protein